MYSNILIPVVLDESRNVESAFKAAKALSDPNARITLLYVVESVPIYVAEYIPADVITTSRDTLRAKLEALAKDIPDAQLAVADGRPGPRICTWAEENNCDCIVIASHQPAFSDILLGSVAHHVVRHAKTSVHVVR